MRNKDSILAWAKDKGILAGSSATAQSFKFLEEAGELFEEVQQGNPAVPEHLHAMMMEFGDVMVTLVILAELLGIDPDECSDLAVSKIQKRTGRLVNGVFVRDGA